ncbi:transcriptional adapter 1-like [Oppia nitens]|uniref:transcriptional adapter 1-like n=1 Tax=Oppia nitens TaxID=1686743 RepID=UPI0023DB58FE|nr:transcriptional adapter 1-like [Oppia nitens]
MATTAAAGASTSVADPLAVAKRALDDCLGDNFKLYLRAMRQWFTHESTKEEFDQEVTKFLTKDMLKAHNNFLLALFNKCCQLAPTTDDHQMPTSTASTATTTTTASSSCSTDSAIDVKVNAAAAATASSTTADIPVLLVPKTEPKSVTYTDLKPKQPVVKSLSKRLKEKTASLKEKTLKLNFAKKFADTSVGDNGYLSDVRLWDDCQKLSKVSYCQRESVLPDHFMSHLRVFVICWETGLDGVQDNAVKLCNAALRDFIKAILMEIFASRSSYRLRENRFKYNIGGPPINPYIKNSYSLIQDSDYLSSTLIHPESGESVTIMPSIDDSTNRAMNWMACSVQQSLKRPHLVDDTINLRHLLYCLKANRNLIPVLSVSCNAYYRTVAKLIEVENNSSID